MHATSKCVPRNSEMNEPMQFGTEMSSTGEMDLASEPSFMQSGNIS